MKGSRTAAAALSIALLAGSAMLLSACSNAGSESDSGTAGQLSRDDSSTADAPEAGTLDRTSDGVAAAPDAAGDLSAGQSSAGQNSAGSNAAGGNLADVVVERKVIATAEMTLRSRDVDATVDAIESIAVAANGYVSARDVQNDPDDPDRTRASITIRVPTGKLESVISDAQAEGDTVRVVSDEQDVTQTVVDVNSRVQSARASVDRIRVLLSQANTIGDVVRIESELSHREADLESLLAQQRALADQTAMATLSVTVLAPEAAEPIPAKADNQGFIAGLERGWNALVDAVVVALTIFGVLLPFLVVAAVVLIPVLLAWRNRRPRGGPRNPEPEPIG
jgi:hypothetical protein